MRGLCRNSGSNSTHEGKISEIDALVRLGLEDFWIGQERSKRQQITGQGRPRPAGNSSNFLKYVYAVKKYFGRTLSLDGDPDASHVTKNADFQFITSVIAIF